MLVAKFHTLLDSTSELYQTLFDDIKQITIGTLKFHGKSKIFLKILVPFINLVLELSGPDVEPLRRKGLTRVNFRMNVSKIQILGIPKVRDPLPNRDYLQLTSLTLFFVQIFLTDFLSDKKIRLIKKKGKIFYEIIMVQKIVRIGSNTCDANKLDLERIAQ